MSAPRLACGISNGISGDGRLELVIRECRDVAGAGNSRDLIPAIETNGGPTAILVDPTWHLGDAVDVASAANLLGTTPLAIRDAVLATWPALVAMPWGDK